MLSPNPPPDLRDLDLNELRRAVAIYLSHAYATGEVPAAVLRRLDWPEAADPAELLSRPPFERVNKAAAPPIHALRLGNAKYPHMKLQVQPWPTTHGYMLSVNTHDQVAELDPSSPGSEAFRNLQAENARIKDAIEHAWDEAGLPIFLRYLRDYLKDHPGSP